MLFQICLFLLVACTSLFGLPAQVIIIRHAEKDPVTRQLSEQGQQRAGALAYYLTETDYLLQFGPPVALFASRPINKSDRIVPRTIETMMPVAELLQMPIHSPYNGYQVTQMANLVLTNSMYNGKSVIICWNHSSIHDLVNAFGYQLPFKCTAPNSKYPDCRFDLTTVLTFPAPPGTGGAPPYATVYFQQLLYGDLTCETIPPYPPSLPAPTCSCNSTASCAQICSVVCQDVGLGDD